MPKAREVTTLDFDGATSSFFPDLVKETLDCHRAPRPLIDNLCNNAINYRWGFPACLIANKDSRITTLHFPEDLEKFSLKPNITPLELPGWQKDTPALVPSPGTQWQKVS